MNVAPYVGAWIETTISVAASFGTLSHPTWVRGLKLVESPVLVRTPQSHPTWVRGLKPFCEKVSSASFWSHPTWVRGLKHTCCGRVAILATVAPYVGAWIETLALQISAAAG